MSEQFIGAGWAFPLRVDTTGGIALVAREQEIEEAIRLILGTSPGERPMRPEFGCRIHDYVFAAADGETAERDRRRGPRVPAPLGAAHRRRGRRSSPSTGPSPALLYIDVRYVIKATNDRRNLVFPFYVIPGGRLTMALPVPEPRRPPVPGPGGRRQAARPAACPEWTDHNVSDPGVTLIELFAWMTDQLVYRLNRVPDRHYIKFLDLIGVSLFPPRPRGPQVTFWLSAPSPTP